MAAGTPTPQQPETAAREPTQTLPVQAQPGLARRGAGFIRHRRTRRPGGARAVPRAGRAGGATICPSEAAREVGSEDGWRDLMEPARRAARRLVAAGEVEITQGGKVVDPSSAKGPIRIRRVR